MGLIVVAILAAGPCAAAETDQDAFACATAAWEIEHWDEALSGLRRAERLHPRALYIYNRALVLEKLGRYAEAKVQLARVGAMPDATEDDRRLARARAEFLSERLRSAELLLPTGVLLQVGEVMLGEGVHLVDGAPQLMCWTQGSETRCRTLSLEIGRRHDWPLPDPGVTGLVDLSAWSPARVRLGGHTLLLDANRLRLDAGRHAVEIGGAAYSVLLGPQEIRALAPPASPREPSAWPWAVGGLGLAGVVAGGTLLIAGQAESAGDPDETERAAQARWEGRNQKLTAGWSTASVGLFCLAVGVTWLLLER